MLDAQKKLSNSFFTLLSLPATAVGFALSTQIAALSWILSTKFQLSMEESVAVWLAGPLAGIIGQPIVGLISDKIWFLGGRRRPFIIIGGIIGALMFLALPNISVISQKLGFEGIMLVATIVVLMLDLSINVTFNPARSIISDVTPEGKMRTLGYTWMQVISGIFGVLAYLISLAYGNDILLKVAVVIVFLFAIVPTLFISEPKDLNIEEEKGNKTSFLTIVKIIKPLYGFLLFSIFIAINKLIIHNSWDYFQTKFMFGCIALSIALGVITVLEGRKKQSNENEFQKIMIAHAFSWLGIQSMFVVSYFFIKDDLLKNIELGNVFANSFSKFVSGKEQTLDSTAGNITAFAFMLLNLLASFLPILLIQPLCRKIGRVKTYAPMILISCLGYLYLSQYACSEINFYIGIFFVSFGWAAIISLVFSITSERIDKTKMGLFMGLFNYAVVLPQMMSSGVSRLITEQKDYSLLYMICALALLISFGFWLFVKEPEVISAQKKISSGH